MKKIIISGKCGPCRGTGELQRGNENSCRLLTCPSCFGSGELAHEYLVDEALDINFKTQ